MDLFYFCSRGYSSPQISHTRINVAKLVYVRETAQQIFGWGAKEECVKEILGGAGGGEGHACGFLFNFSKVTENAIVTIKLLIFFHIFSDVAIGPENSPSLN